MKTVLSLFDYTGNWSLPYRENGYHVIQIDIRHGRDVREFDYKNIGPVHGVLAAPPCTDFAVSGARWWHDKDVQGDTLASVELVRHTLEIVHYLDPVWWALENPVGRLNSLIPELRQWGPWYFQPCDYGETYTKKTGLWGRFVPPLPIFVGTAYKPVEPHEGSKMHLLPPSPERQMLRSVTPLGFARAFYEANK